jgi:hypothetical protein
MHPDFPKRGFRKLKTSDEFYISDVIKKGRVYRFMHLFNFKNSKFLSKEYSHDLNASLIHWLPVSDNLVNTEVIMPGKKVRKGLAEPGVNNLKIGTTIQFERMFFCTLEKKEKNKVVFNFLHK